MLWKTLVLIGVVSILAAIVGGGLSAFSINIPFFNGKWRIACLFVFGLACVILGYSYVRPEELRENTKPTPDATGPANNNKTIVKNSNGVQNNNYGTIACLNAGGTNNVNNCNVK
jgi:hypothetical protein